MIEILSLLAIICTAIIFGNLVSRLKLPSILGWLLAGMIFGPCLGGIVQASTISETWYQVVSKCFEAFAGVMIGSEIVFKKLKKYGKQIVFITLFQSLITFAFVSLAFAVVFAITDIPIYLAFIFGGIALATAPAPALSIVNEFKTDGPVTKTLIPLAALDDIIGIIVFFSVISIVSTVLGQGTAAPVSPLDVVLMLVFPFAIGIGIGLLSGLIMKKIKNNKINLLVMVLSLAVCIFLGLICDKYYFHGFKMNYLMIGMAFSATIVNMIDEVKCEKVLKLYNPILSISLVVVIVNLGMPLDYKLIAGAGAFTIIYIIARAIGKIGGSAIGGIATKAEPTVKKYLGFTLLPHSGVSLIFTGIAASTLMGPDPDSAKIIQGTIAAAAIINEIIAVILAKFAFKWAGELDSNKKIVQENPQEIVQNSNEN